MSHDRNSSNDVNASAGFALDSPAESETKKPRRRSSAPKSSYRCPQTIDWIEELLGASAPGRQ